MNSDNSKSNILVRAISSHHKAIETLDLSETNGSHHYISVLKGSLKVQVESKIWNLSSNRSILIQSGTQYQVRVEARTTLCTLKISRESMPLEEQAHLIEVTPLLKEITLQVARQQILSSEINRDVHIFEILKDHLNSKHSENISIPLPKDERALKIYHLIVDKKQFDQSFEHLASKVGASKRTLERIFQNEIGMTFSKWRQLLRLQHSLTLLEKGTSVAEISGEVGYGSSSAFIHAFKEYFGYSPGQHLSTKKENLS